ncbi:TIGR03084 family metal-binding protein [Pikeienuella sp. HZG-20]|uniref:TIGR03084 family metal-binding protein n=1 Tax=Paludibacillus litoralis TaxID=3133267 RepID=UPI0030EC2AE4
MREAQDFLEESEALAALLAPLEDEDFARPTQFKGWTIDDVLGHLHIFNHAAELTLARPDAFGPFLASIMDQVAEGRTLAEAQRGWIGDLTGRALLAAWRDGAARLAEVYAAADPKTRVKWAGPDMSARSSITARQMETWAHGQEVFDLLGASRADTDRLRNIAHLGVVTIPFAFSIRGETPPDPPLHVRLIAPSGAIWEWNEPQTDNRIDGSATAFCQTAAQVRNAADTDLRATGPAAERWLQIAQCFAGAPHDPPAPGARYRQTGERG